MTRTRSFEKVLRATMLMLMMMMQKRLKKLDN